MDNKLPWEEIKKLYDQEWIELINYEWPDEEPYPLSGIVRVHAKTRQEFDKLTEVDPPENSAYVYVGKPSKQQTSRSFSKVVFGNMNA